MSTFAQLLESELNEILIKQNKDAVKRVSYLFSEKIEKIERLEEKFLNEVKQIEQRELESKLDVRLLTETMRQGFDSVNKRFEDMQKNMDKRFDMTLKFMGLGFTVISLLIVIFKLVK